MTMIASRLEPDGQSTFILTRRVKFSEADPSAIIYFPNFFDCLHELVEAWINDGLGIDYRSLYYDRRISFPTVHASFDFVSRVKWGFDFTLTLRVTRLGRSTIDLAVTVEQDGEIKARARHLLATIDLATFKSVAIPDDIRAGMLPFAAKTVSES